MDWYWTLDATAAADECALRNCFDATVASGYFSQFTGVLTGVAFTGAVLVVQRIVSPADQGVAGREVAGLGSSRGDPEPSRLRAALLTLIASVACLAITTFCFAVVSGIDAPGEKAQSLYLVSNAALVVSSTVFLWALWEMLHDVVSPTSRKLLRNFILALVPIMFGYAIVTSADVSTDPQLIGDVAAVRMRPPWLAFIVVLSVCGFAALRKSSTVLARREWIVPFAGLGSSILLVAIFTPWVLQLRELDRALPLGAVYAILAIVMVFLLVFAGAVATVSEAPSTTVASSAGPQVVPTVLCLVGPTGEGHRELAKACR